MDRIKLNLITNSAIIGNALKNDRKTHKLTQEILGVKARVDRRTVMAAESGKNVGLHEFIRMANSLGLELSLKPMQSISFEDVDEFFKE